MSARRGFAVASLVLGIVGALFGLIPYTFAVAAILGAVGLPLGIAAWGRARGLRLSRGVPVAGTVLSAVACVLSIVGFAILVAAAPETVRDDYPVGVAADYQPLDARSWQEVAKHPDGHAGRKYTVHGIVTQFDAATGTDTFLAGVDGPVARPDFELVDYATPTQLRADTAAAGLVKGDTFTARVTVLGSTTYDNVMGGRSTVPLLRADSITVDP